MLDKRKNFLSEILENDEKLKKDDGFDFDTSEMDDLNQKEIIDDFSSNEIKTFTNFFKHEFKLLFSKFEGVIAKLRYKKGPKNKLSTMDSFFLLLVYLKTYPSFATLARNFSVSASSLQRIIEKLIIGLKDKFVEEFICFLSKESQLNKSIGFKNFPDVAMVLDCTIQEIPRFAGGFSEVKTFYSEKHKKYCVKKEIGHLPNGIACFVSKFWPGSKHDFSIFISNVEFYKTILKKEGNLCGFWSIMADKGYEGANNYIPSVLPKKGLI